jgi:cell division protein FtsW
VHSDFAFAAISEEWGYVGSLSVLICCAILAYRGLRIASRTNQLFNLFLAAGITVMFSAQSFLIMAGVTKVLPLTGVTLPFVSYGGSSLLISCVMVGLMLNLSAKDPG